MTSLVKNARRHDITIHHDGRIDISSHVARMLELAPGDVVDIVREGSELYLCVRMRAGSYAGRFSGRCRYPSGSRKGTVRVIWPEMAREVLRLAGCDGSRLRCPCGEVITRGGRTYVTIIHTLSL